MLYFHRMQKKISTFEQLDKALSANGIVPIKKGLPTVNKNFHKIHQNLTKFTSTIL